MKRRKAFIDSTKCTGTGACAKICPVNAISGDLNKVHVVDTEKCIGCGICESYCSVKAISSVPATSAILKESVKTSKANCEITR